MFEHRGQYSELFIPNKVSEFGWTIAALTRWNFCGTPLALDTRTGREPFMGPEHRTKWDIIPRLAAP
jgi:hypothetical protein